VRPELQQIVDALLASSEDRREVALDAIGEALGARAVTPAEIEEVIATLEHRGRRVYGAETGRGADNLRAVLTAARALAAELGRPATRAEIAAKSGLSDAAVAHALAFAKVLQR
jgi:hypothetical protein